MKEELVEKIKSLIDQIRPFLENDGGNIEFIKFEDGIVYVKMLGACAGCQMMKVTLKNSVEQFITNEIPEVKEVRNVE